MGKDGISLLSNSSDPGLVQSHPCWAFRSWDWLKSWPCFFPMIYLCTEQAKWNCSSGVILTAVQALARSKASDTEVFLDTKIRRKWIYSSAALFVWSVFPFWWNLTHLPWKSSGASAWSVTIFCPRSCSRNAKLCCRNCAWKHSSSWSRRAAHAAFHTWEPCTLLLQWLQPAAGPALLLQQPDWAPWAGESPGMSLPQSQEMVEMAPEHPGAPRAQGQLLGWWDVLRDPPQQLPSNCWNSAKTFNTAPGQVGSLMWLKPSRVVGPCTHMKFVFWTKSTFL